MTMKKGKAFFVLSVLFLLVICQEKTLAQSFRIPEDTRQLIVGLSNDWNDSTVQVQRWEKSGSVWKKVGEAWPGRLGTSGLAWGRGLHPAGLSGVQKKEGDKRAPAGVFSLGDVYSYDAAVHSRPGMKVYLVTEKDLWVEDEASDFYNQHVVLPGRGPETEWEKKQQMRLNDPAHRLKWFIKHNAESDIVKGAGSSIFFHIWRDGGARSSYGCTVMAEENLREMITWVEPKQKPLYVLLPKAVYEDKRAHWALP